MSSEELQHLTELLEILKRRKYQRELQVARLGISVEPHISIDLENLGKEIARIEKSIRQLDTTANQIALKSDQLKAGEAYAKIEIEIRNAIHSFEMVSDDVAKLGKKIISYIDKITGSTQLNDYRIIDIAGYQHDHANILIVEQQAHAFFHEAGHFLLSDGRQSLNISSTDADEVRSAVRSFVDSAQAAASLRPKKKRKRRKKR